MINFDNYTNENKTEHNSSCPYVPDHRYRILIVGGSGSGKTNTLLNLIKNRPDIDKIYLYAKDPYESKYQYLFNKREKVGLDHFHDPEAFMEYSNDMLDVYKKIEDYNPDKKRIMKTQNKREFQQITLNHSSDIDSKDFMQIYKKCTAEPYSFLVNDTILPSDNPLRFRKNLLK